MASQATHRPVHHDCVRGRVRTVNDPGNILRVYYEKTKVFRRAALHFFRFVTEPQRNSGMCRVVFGERHIRVGTVK